MTSHKAAEGSRASSFSVLTVTFCWTTVLMEITGRALIRRKNLWGREANRAESWMERVFGSEAWSVAVGTGASLAEVP